MTIKLWANFNHGPVDTGSNVRGVYTLGATEYSAGDTTLEGSGSSSAIAIAAPGGDWASRNVLDQTGHFSLTSAFAVSSGDIGPSAGRILMLLSLGTLDPGDEVFQLHAATFNNGSVALRVGTSDMVVRYRWTSQDPIAVTLSRPATGDPVWVEIIYDQANGAASQRLRARSWAIGGSPPSFTNTADSSTTGTQDAFTVLTFRFRIRVGHFIISDDVAEDLSAYVSTENYPSGPAAPEITSVTPSTISAATAAVTVAGENFQASQGTGSLVFSPSQYDGGNAGTTGPNDTAAEAQVIDTWSDTSIVSDGVVIPAGMAHNDTIYVFVVDDDGNFNEVGFSATLAVVDPALRVATVGGSSDIVDIDTGDPIPNGTYTVITVPAGDVASGTIRRHSVSLTSGALADIVDAAYETLTNEFHLIGLNADGTQRFHADAAVIDRNA